MTSSESSTAVPLPRNALRTILFVAARGVVRRNDLSEFQLSLPPRDWGDRPPIAGWQPLKPLLAWQTVVLPESRAIPLHVLVKTLVAHARRSAVGEAKQLIRDLEHLVDGPDRSAVLEQTLVVPRTELGLRLSHRRTSTILAAYGAALHAGTDSRERRRFAARFDFTAADRALRAIVDRPPQPVLYEAVDHGTVAAAVLAKKASVRRRGDRFQVIFSLGSPQRVHRLYLLSVLRRPALAEALGVPPSCLRRSDHPQTAVEVRPLSDVESELLRAKHASHDASAR